MLFPVWHARKSIRWLALAVIALAGCGRPERDSTPRVQLDSEWVQEVRANAAKAIVSAGGAKKKGEGWGTLEGLIRLKAEPPRPPDIVATKDENVCGRTVKNDALALGDNLALANAVVFLRTKTDVHESFAASEKTDVALDNKGCRFQPHVTVMRFTQKLAVKNSDSVLHNTRIDSSFNADNKNVQPGTIEPFTMKVPEPAPVPISCSVHPWMRSYVLIKDHPYAAVTDKAGKFTIPNLPAGVELEFQVWHEATPNGLGGSSEQAAIDARGRFKLTIPKDQPLHFEMTAALQ